MSKPRLLLLVMVVAVSCLASAVALGSDQAPAAGPAYAAPSSSMPSADPFLGGEIATRIPLAQYCQDYGQCASTPPGTPCDTPRGCVCGYSSGQLRCGRF
jgi:hypothetical protein